MAAKKTVDNAQLKTELVASTRMRLYAALLLLLDNTAELTEEDFEAEQPIPEATLPHRDAILAMVKALDIALIPASAKRDELLAEAAVQRHALAADAKLLDTALDSMGVVTERIQDAFTLQGLEKMDEVSINKAELLRDCVEFLEAMAQTDANRPFTQELLSCFPFAIARERFYAYVREALPPMLADADATMAEDYLDSKRYRLFPESMPGYTEKYPAFLERVRAFAAREYTGLTEDELQEAHEEALTLAEDLEYAAESLKVPYESYQFLLMLLTFADDADSLLADDPVAKDVFHATVESLANGDYDAYRDSLLASLDDRAPKAIDVANASHQKVLKQVRAAGLKSLEADAELAALLRVKESVEELFFGELAQHGFWSTGETVTHERARTMTDEFLDGVKTMLAPLPPKTQKVLRRELFTQIPCVMTADELYAYLDAAFDAAPGFLQKALTVEKLGRLFERYEYNPPGKDLHEGHTHDHAHTHHHHHHHHHHGEECDCGCGHEHEQ